MSSKYETIYKDILANIRNGVLKNGDKVPTEHEIMDQYMVSRITAQRALNYLSENNYVERQPGRGSFVKFDSGYPDYNENAFSPSFVSLIMANQLQTLSFIHGIEQYLSTERIQTAISLTNNNAGLELEAVKKAVNGRSRGIIFYPCEPFVNHEIFQKLIRDGFPLVFLDRAPLELPCNCITTDGFKGGYIATKYLLDHGHRKIAIINSGFDIFETVKHRYAGFCAAMEDYGAPVNPEYVLECYGMMDYGKELLTMPDPPTAIFCTNDSVALHIYNLAYTLGISLPNDLSIIGFDNLPVSAQMIPPLTTIEQPFAKMGIEAAKVILNQSKTNELVKKFLPVNLLKRASVRDIR